MSSLVRGSLLIAAGTIYKILLTILIDKYLAINLGVEDFGQYKYGITIVLLLSTFCSLGMRSSIIRTIAIQNSFDKKKILITISLLLVIAMSLPIVALALTKSSLFGIDSTFLYATLFFGVNALFSSIYSGLEKPKLKVWINDIFGFTVYLAFLWVFFNFQGSSEDIAQVYLCYVIAVFIINLGFSKKYLIQVKKEYLNGEGFKEYLQYSAPLFGVSLLIMLSTHLDKLILNLFVSEKQLGIYYAVFTISNLLPLILTILVFMYLPRMSRFIKSKNLDRATLLSSYFSKWTMIMASVFFGMIIYYSEDILSLLYSREFVEGALVLKILALGQWINVSLGFTGQNLLALGDSKSQLYIRTSSFILGGILLFLGAKYYGNLGASISILIALLASNMLQIVVLRAKHGFVGYRKQNFYALSVIMFIGIVLTMIHNLNWLQNLNFLVLMLIDIIIFMVLLLTTKVLGKKDIRALKITED